VPNVVLEGVTVRRGNELALDDVTFRSPSGSLTMLLGPSGSGKTSVLRAIAGLDRLHRGTVRFGDRDMTQVPPGERDLGIAFDRPALLTTRDVAGNLAFPLEVRRETADMIEQRIGVEARTMHIEHLLHRAVGELSAGESHMVQVARALVRTPQVLLLDEPFATIEGRRSAILRREVRHLQREFDVTTIMASNDPTDARALADSVVVLERGRVVQVGSFEDVFARPATAAAARSTGDAAIDVVTIEADGHGAWIVHPAFRVRAWAPSVRRHAGRRLQLITRPEWWVVDPNGTIVGTVVRAVRWGTEPRLTVDVDGHRVAVSGRSFDEGDRVRLRLASWTLLDPLDGRRID